MQFNFGKNWQDFSSNALTKEKVDKATLEFKELVYGLRISGKSFLDIGYGQGLSLLIAKSMGAKVMGIDINPLSKEILEQNQTRFTSLTSITPGITGSILDDTVLYDIKKHAKADKGQYDIVHSWGVLHHTGDMYAAIKKSAALTKSNGYFIISIYNRHWTSRYWLWIKYLYNKSPKVLQKLLIYLLYPLIYLAKYFVTGENPLKKQRGMDFFYDVVDWVGGYPYEYASADEISLFVERLGFTRHRLIAATVPTGCNEFVFKKI